MNKHFVSFASIPPFLCRVRDASLSFFTICIRRSVPFEVRLYKVGEYSFFFHLSAAQIRTKMWYNKITWNLQIHNRTCTLSSTPREAKIYEEWGALMSRRHVLNKIVYYVLNACAMRCMWVLVWMSRINGDNWFWRTFWSDSRNEMIKSQNTWHTRCIKAVNTYIHSAYTVYINTVAYRQRFGFRFENQHWII